MLSTNYINRLLDKKVIFNMSLQLRQPLFTRLTKRKLRAALVILLHVRRLIVSASFCFTKVFPSLFPASAYKPDENEPTEKGTIYDKSNFWRE